MYMEELHIVKMLPFSSNVSLGIGSRLYYVIVIGMCLTLEGKNGDFRQETEEFERALAEVSRNEKLSAAAAAAGEAAYMSETDEGDELTKQIAGSYMRTRTIGGVRMRNGSY